MALVSVYVLCFNHAKFIKQRIDTVLQQTFTDYDLHIFDDASSDESIAIIELYRNEPQVKSIVYNDNNSGSGYLQWKKAIEDCSSKYIWIAEGDDFAEPLFLERTVATLERNEQLGLVEVNANCVFDAGFGSTTAVTKAQSFKSTIWNDDFEMEGAMFIREYLLYGCAIVNVSAVLFRSAVIKNEVNVLVVYKYCADWQLYINILKRWQFAYLSQPLGFFSIHENSVINKNKHTLNFYKERLLVAISTFHFVKSYNEVSLLKFVKSIGRYFFPARLSFVEKMKFIIFLLRHDIIIGLLGLYFALKHRLGINNE